MASLKRTMPLLLLPLMLMIGGCDSRRAGVLESLLTSDQGDWLYRDPVEDPYEWQNGRCCNDYTPTPVSLGTIINAAINPADDLDYFDLRYFILSSSGLINPAMDADAPDGLVVTLPAAPLTLLRISADTDALSLRLFTVDSTLEQVKIEVAIDSVWLDVPSGTGTVATLFQWAYIYNYDRERLLIQGDGSTAPIAYQALWQSVPATVGLDITKPSGTQNWQRGEPQSIAWESTFSGGVTVGLLGDGGMVRILKRDITFSSELNWTPEIDIAPGAYQIIIYLAADPTAAEVSNVITIE